MKPFYTFLIALAALGNLYAQEIALPSPGYSTDFNADMVTGSFSVAVPLFDMETASPDLSLQARLIFNRNVYDNSVEQNYALKSFLPPGMEFNIIPAINKSIKGHDAIDDELYYNTPNLYTNPVEARPMRPQPNIYSFDIFGLQGKFYFEQQEGQMVLKKLYTSDYADIKANITFTRVKIADSSPSYNRPEYNYTFQVHSFEVTDKNGFVYMFNDVQESGYYFSSSNVFYDGKRAQFNPYKKSFLLKQVKDRFGRVLLDYHYGSYASQITNGSKTYNYTQKYLNYITVAHTGSVVFEFDETVKKYRGVKVYNLFDGQSSLIHDITISTGPDPQIVFYNKDRSAAHRYSFNHTPTTTQYILPTGGSTLYEMEDNTYGFTRYGANNFFTEPLDQMEDTFTDVPVTFNLVSQRWQFSYPDEDLYNHPLYLTFNAKLSPIVDGNGNMSSIRLGLANQAGSILTYFSAEMENEIRPTLELHQSQFPTRQFYFKSASGNTSDISNIKLRKKTRVLNPTKMMEKKAEGKRLKKVTQYERNNVIASETFFRYVMQGDPYRSSGAVPLQYYRQNDFSQLYGVPYVPCVYRYVGVEKAGAGKTVYGFDYTGAGGSTVALLIRPETSIPVEEYAYTDNGTLISQSSSTISYFNYPVADTSIAYEQSGMVERMDKTTTEYTGTASRAVQTITQWDMDTRHVIKQEIKDMNTGEVFVSDQTFVKKHQTYFPETVKKYKNSQLLNQSAFEYTPVSGNPQVVNLSKSYVAKSTLALEIDKEITRYDAYGNVLEYKTKTGRVVSQIWGYDGTQLVAELKNVAYGSISAATITAIQTASNAASYNETNLNTAFTQLRDAHANGFITTYTYRPLVGMTSVTDANGRRESYQYDSFNRLYRVVNHEGQVTKEYQYNTKNQ